MFDSNIKNGNALIKLRAKSQTVKQESQNTIIIKGFHSFECLS